jgi:hypothetical protein
MSKVEDTNFSHIFKSFGSKIKASLDFHGTAKD